MTIHFKSSSLHYLACAALAGIILLGCNLTGKESDNPSKTDLSHLPANRYAGLSCNEILDSVDDELHPPTHDPDSPPSEASHEPYIKHGAWSAYCEIFDYRAVLIDTLNLQCPNAAFSVDSCKFHFQRLTMGWFEKPERPIRHSGVYDMKCRYDFADGLRDVITTRFGLISDADCPMAVAPSANPPRAESFRYAASTRLRGLGLPPPLKTTGPGELESSTP